MNWGQPESMTILMGSMPVVDDDSGGGPLERRLSSGVESLVHTSMGEVAPVREAVEHRTGVGACDGEATGSWSGGSVTVVRP